MSMDFTLFVLLPSACTALLVFLVGRRLEHTGGMREPELADLDTIDPDATITLSGEVQPLEGLIPSPILGDPPVLAWSLETERGSGERETLSRWAPFVIRREDGTEVSVRRLLAFEPKRARVTAHLDEHSLGSEPLQHLRRQQRAALVQLGQIRAWLVDGDADYEPDPSDFDEPYEPSEERSYRVSVLRPGDPITTVTRVRRVRSSNDGAAGFFLFPKYSYPLTYVQARSPWLGQGRFVLALAAASAGVVGVLSTIGWLLGVASK